MWLEWQGFDGSIVFIWLQQVINCVWIRLALPWNKEAALVWHLLPPELLGAVANSSVSWYLSLQGKYLLVALMPTVCSAMRAKPRGTEERVRREPSQSPYTNEEWQVGSTNFRCLRERAYLEDVGWLELFRRSDLLSVLVLAGCSGLQQLCTSSPVNITDTCSSEKNVWDHFLPWDLDGDILGLLHDYWKTLDMVEGQRKTKITLIFRKGKKSWELQAGQTLVPGKIMEQFCLKELNFDPTSGSWLCHLPRSVPNNSVIL